MKQQEKTILITGAARRIGKAIAKYLHASGYNLIIHYRSSKQQAEDIISQLNQKRQGSAIAIQADFSEVDSYQTLISKALKAFGCLDGLINNASSFFPTQLGSVEESQWNDLFVSNSKVPFFLAQAAMNTLNKSHGCIINIIDVHGLRPLKNYAVYSMAKASLVMQTKALALELAPKIRVNAIAPGNILWPEGENALNEKTKKKIITTIPLQRQGSPHDIAHAALFLLQAPYITGQVLAVDGGKAL